MPPLSGGSWAAAGAWGGSGSPRSVTPPSSASESRASWAAPASPRPRSSPGETPTLAGGITPSRTPWTSSTRSCWGCISRCTRATCWGPATAPILPARFTPTVKQMVDRLNELAPQGEPIKLAGAVQVAKEALTAAERLDTAVDVWRQRADVPKEIEQTVNGTLKGLSRILVPLGGTVAGTYGHDPYGLSAQSTLLPGLYDLPRMNFTPGSGRGTRDAFPGTDSPAEPPGGQHARGPRSCQPDRGNDREVGFRQLGG